MRKDTQISVTKIIEAFGAFGTVEEGKIVEVLLKGIGTYDREYGQYVFTPQDVKNYRNVQKETAKTNIFTEANIDYLIRGLLGDD